MVKTCGRGGDLVEDEGEVGCALDDIAIVIPLIRHRLAAGDAGIERDARACRCGSVQ